MTEQQGDEQATDSSVSVEKGVDGLELRMRQGCFHKCRRIGVQEALQLPHAAFDFLRRRGHKRRVPRPCATNPVLRATKFSRGLLCAAPGGQKYSMHFLEQAIRPRKPVAPPPEAMRHRCNV